ncbi:hypothetical protein NMY22_g6467 [Coprinellus aureogranulatus]|nr:hypothetical protein NMY22_g6467 [Coprinellus aureogranulatus]
MSVTRMVGEMAFGRWNEAELLPQPPRPVFPMKISSTHVSEMGFRLYSSTVGPMLCISYAFRVTQVNIILGPSHITGLLPLLHVTPMYRVFLGAPPISTWNSTESYHWQTISTSDLRHPHSTPLTAANSNEQESFMQWPMKSISASRLQRADSFMYPPATLEAASRRISMIYRNAIFDRTEAGDADEPEEEEGEDGGRQLRGDMTTVITWPPTNPGEGDSVGEASRLTRSRGSISFLRAGSQDESMDPPVAPDGEVGAVSDSGFFESQQTQSFNYSDASSIARFPTFHFNIHALSSLSQLTKTLNAQGRLVPATVKGRKVNLLLAILEVDGPETITIKNGKDAGKKVGLLKLILGDQEGSVCKLTAWREVAEEWGGVGRGLGCKRGDVVHLENVTVDCDPSTSPNLTASPNLKSKMTVCYRTMPYAHEDGVFRPDLRLGESDPCVRKVAAVRCTTQKQGFFLRPPASPNDNMNAAHSRHSPTDDDEPPSGYWYLGVQIPDPNLPTTGLGMQKVPGFYPQDVWETLENMIEVAIVNDRAIEAADPAKVCRLLLNMTLFQRDAVERLCQVYERWIAVWLDEAVLCCLWRVLDSLRGIVEGPLTYDLFLLEGTLSGKFRGDEMTMVEIICDRNLEDLQLLMSEYERANGRKLTDAIRTKYSGRKLENLLLSALTLERQSDSLPVDESQVREDIAALKEAIEERDDKVLTEILTKRSRPHLAAVVTEYASQHGNLRKQIKERWNAKGLLYIIDGAKAKRDGQGAWRDAKLLEETMKGLGPRDTKLQYRLVRAHWDSSRFSAVKRAYRDRYGKTLEKRIAGDTSGNYNTVLQLICETSHN